MKNQIERLLDEPVGDGMHYTEVMDSSFFPSRRVCSLVKDGVENPVSRLSLAPLNIRFGATAVAAEGFAGVHTVPEYRSRGFARMLMEQALEGVRARVNAAFLYGIEDFYGSFGFVSCVPENSISIWIRRTKGVELPDRWSSVIADTDDVAEVIELFNDIHRERPWTAVRDAATVRRLMHGSSWRPAPETVVLKNAGRIVAYAVLPGKRFGGSERNLEVFEAGAGDVEAARVLLGEIGRKCRKMDIEEFTISEPPDGSIGHAAQLLGCTVVTKTVPDGEGMGLVLNREALIRELSGELKRRVCASSEWYGASFDEKRTGLMIDRLARGDEVGDNGELMCLLIGYKSRQDFGGRKPSPDERLMRAMFPAGGQPWLPLPHSHRLDRY